MNSVFSIKTNLCPLRFIVFVDTALERITPVLNSLYGRHRDLTVELCSTNFEKHYALYSSLLRAAKDADETPYVISVQGDVVGDKVLMALSHIADATFCVTAKKNILSLKLRKPFGPFMSSAAPCMVTLSNEGIIKLIHENHQSNLAAATNMETGHNTLPSSTFSLFLTAEQAAAKSAIILPHMRMVGDDYRGELPVLAYDYDPEDEIDE